MTARHNLGENVQVRENADGEAVIEHKPSGKTVKVNEDGAVTEAFRTDEVNNTHHVDPSMTSTEINEVIEDVESEGGGSVIFAPGTYELEDDDNITAVSAKSREFCIYCRDKVNLFGYGAKIAPVNGENAIFADYDFDADIPGIANNFVVAGFELDGQNIDSTDGHDNGNGVLLQWSEQTVVRDIEAYGWDNMGVHFDAPVESWVQNCYVHDNDRGIHYGVRGNPNGYLFDQDPIGPIRSVALDNRCVDNRGSALTLNDGFDSVLAFNTVVGGDSISSPAIRVEGVRSYLYYNHVTESNMPSGIRVQEGNNTGNNAQDTYIIGGSVANLQDDRSERGVRIQNAESVTIKDVSIGGFDGDGLHASDTKSLTTSGVIVDGVDGWGYRIEESVGHYRSFGDSMRDTGGRWRTESDGSRILFPHIFDTNGRGIELVADGCVVIEPTFNGIGDNDALRLDGADNRVRGGEFSSVDSSDIRVLSGASRTQLENMSGIADVDTGGENTIVNGRGFNSGDPNTAGDWDSGFHRSWAEKSGFVIEDTENGNLYMAVDDSYVQIN